ncbi:MAG: hypothetical protein AB8B65_00055 [Kordia sp.]|uniref:hypothetical protein n=1 Tax=Kordia sp. TaxID=1965332 RepID=UPI003858083E
MNIEFYFLTDYDDDAEVFAYNTNEKIPIKQIYSIDIDENAPIRELFSKLHDITNISRYREVTWDGNVEKIACKYYYKHKNEFTDFSFVEDLDRKIKDFPKNGSNGELSLHMNLTIYYGN